MRQTAILMCSRLLYHNWMGSITKYTVNYRALGFFSSRPNWDPPPPHHPSTPMRGPPCVAGGGGGHTCWGVQIPTKGQTLWYSYTVYSMFLSGQHKPLIIKRMLIAQYALFTLSHKVHIYRVAQCMSPHRNWDTPPPLSRKQVCPAPRTKGGGAQSPAGEGWGSPNSDLAFCLLCGLPPPLEVPHPLLSKASEI